MREDRHPIVRRMCESGLLPVFRTQDVTHLLAASKAYGEAGIPCVEYTLTMPGALQLVGQAARTLAPALTIGAGTVLDGDAACAAIEAGAQFLASPGRCRPMIEICRRRGIPSVVGALTPTEIMEALELGADVIKVFPASSVGPGFFAEVLGPFPGACLMAAGGITVANVKDYLGAGASVLTFLANGIDAAAYASGDAAAIGRAAGRFVAAVRAARLRGW